MLSTDLKTQNLLQRTKEIVTSHGCEAYLVGGFVRDYLIRRKTNDVDIAVKGNALLIAEQYSKVVGGRYVLLDEENKVARTVIYLDDERYYVDFSSFSDSIQDDLSRRDFTIDAMAIILKDFDTVKPIVIDPFKGKQHLKDKIVAAIDENIFKNDPARLLRAVRIAATLNFKISSLTEKAINNNAFLVKQVSGERVRDELIKILASKSAGNWVRYLDTSGLLTEIIPELKTSKGV